MIFPKKLIFRVYALKRMFERSISSEDIRNALSSPQLLKEYADDKPYPSYLILGKSMARPIHIVAAVNNDDQETIIVTAYEPTLMEWNEGFFTRRENK